MGSVFYTQSSPLEMLGWHFEATVQFTNTEEKNGTAWYQTKAARLNLASFAGYVPFLANFVQNGREIVLATPLEGEGAETAKERLSNMATAAKVRTFIEKIGLGILFLPFDLIFTALRLAAGIRFLSQDSGSEMFGLHISDTVCFAPRNNEPNKPWHCSTALRLNACLVLGYIPFAPYLLNKIGLTRDPLLQQRLPNEKPFAQTDRVKSLKAAASIRTHVEGIGLGAIFAPVDILFTIGRLVAYAYSKCYPADISSERVSAKT